MQSGNEQELLLEPTPDTWKYGRVVDFENEYKKEGEKKSLRYWASNVCRKFWVKQLNIHNHFPFIRVLKKYKMRDDFANDAIAGMTVGIMQIPQGMAYALLATLPPIVGLYMSFFAPLIYFFVGSSRHASMGVIAVVSLMVGSVLDTRLGSSSVVSSGSPTAVNSSDVIFNASATEAPYNVTTSTITTSLQGMDNITLQKVQLAAALTFVSGFIMIILGKLNMGLVARCMSEPMVCGFTSGVAIHVTTTQAKHILGVKIGRFNGVFKVIRTWVALFTNIMTINWAAVITSALCILALYLVKIHINQRYKSKLKIPIPIEIIVEYDIITQPKLKFSLLFIDSLYYIKMLNPNDLVSVSVVSKSKEFHDVAIATIASHFGMFKRNYDVNILEDIPAGLPTPSIPDVTLVGENFKDAFIIGIVAFTQSVSMAKILARKNNYQINPNQEMVAYGAGSVLCSIFLGYIPAASVARSMVQDGAGGHTQVASLFGCIVVLVVILAIGPLFYSLPKCVLSAVILVNLRGMFLQFLELPAWWRKSKYDFMIWIITFLSTVVLDADFGIAIGIIFSVLTVTLRTQRPEYFRAAFIGDPKLIRSNEMYYKGQELPSVRILHFQSPIYFANGELFIKAVRKVSGVIPEVVRKQRKKTVLVEVKAEASNSENVENHASAEVEIVKNNDPGIERIVIDFQGVSFIDVVGVKALRQVFSDYNSIDIDVCLAGCSDGVLATLRGTDFFEEKSDYIYIDVPSAVHSRIEKGQHND